MRADHPDPPWGKSSDRVDQAIRLGAVEEWTVVNDHVFHIHTNPFQVTRINGEALPEPLWRDTKVVPREGRITFRSRFLDFSGQTVLHSHMMNHEELGMMQLLEISATDRYEVRVMAFAAARAAPPCPLSPCAGRGRVRA